MTFEAILLTGYEEFEYAQKALQLDIRDYILKPAQPTRILEAVLQAKHMIEEKQEQDTYVQQLETSYKKNLSTIKKETLSQWIKETPSDSIEKRKQVLQDLGLNIHSGRVHAGVIRLFTHEREPSPIMGHTQLLYTALFNITLETISSVFQDQIEMFQENEDIIWVANIPSSLNKDRIKKALVHLKNNLETYLNISIGIGVGTVKEAINELETSYAEACLAIKRRYYRKDNGILFFDEVSCEQETQKIIINTQLLQLESEILTYMANHMFDAAFGKLEQWIDYINLHPLFDNQDVNTQAFSLVGQIQRLLHEKECTSIEEKEEVIYWIEQIPYIESFTDLSSLIKKVFQEMINIMCANKPIHRTIRLVQAIIHKNYHQNLTLDRMAKEVYVSSAYLSALFKKELGINYLDYLHQYRIEQSKPLLKKNLKIYTVAKMTGYNDEKNFSQTFKKWTGMTPSQFQKGK
ncbi:helix-turn-helix domain-containing protein [Gracilibacillus alcaliphilus]|uniref:helix-turn-helix domain-containing protein n=1 Tax=Gracilibacillus alcaliphilus TaxID=1401441 RepID=UPI0019584328|nr:helix-turn-helix domain-containing protein [Gracilibacillus alcaliphilus]MBM7677404.1 two-component system response regulator YesN [Gracilibacillus alcaliphilus]